VNGRDRPTAVAFRANPNDPRHGTANGYSNLKCRCDGCTAAWRDYHREWMNADPARLKAHARRQAYQHHLKRRSSL
jgi:hypothetical protein